MQGSFHLTTMNPQSETLQDLENKVAELRVTAKASTERDRRLLDKGQASASKVSQTQPLA